MTVSSKGVQSSPPLICHQRWHPFPKHHICYNSGTKRNEPAPRRCVPFSRCVPQSVKKHIYRRICIISYVISGIFLFSQFEYFTHPLLFRRMLFVLVATATAAAPTLDLLPPSRRETEWRVREFYKFKVSQSFRTVSECFRGSNSGLMSKSSGTVPNSLCSSR